MDAEMVACPYNNQHIIIRHRLPYHLVKCRKNYSGPPLVQCPYNAMHLLREASLKEHIAGCPDFHTVMRESYEHQYPIH